MQVVQSVASGRVDVDCKRQQQLIREHGTSVLQPLTYYLPGGVVSHVRYRHEGNRRDSCRLNNTRHVRRASHSTLGFNVARHHLVTDQEHVAHDEH